MTIILWLQEVFWKYYRDDINDDVNENNTANNGINSNKKITNKSFQYERKLIGSTPNNNNILDAEVVIVKGIYYA